MLMHKSGSVNRQSMCEWGAMLATMTVLRGTDLVCVQILLLVSITINLSVLVYFHQYFGVVRDCKNEPTTLNTAKGQILSLTPVHGSFKSQEQLKSILDRQPDLTNYRKRTRQIKYIQKGNINPSENISTPRADYTSGSVQEDFNHTIYISSATDIQFNNPVWMPEEKDYFKKRCPSLQPWMKCRYSSDPASIPHSDAVLFHARLMDIYVPQHHSRFPGLPSGRHPNQKWIFYETESPAYVWNYFANVSDPYWTLFNLTATYSKDSDIPVGSHKYVCKPRRRRRNTKSITLNNNRTQGKKLAAWIVSHCSTDSKREHYVAALKKYMPVDVYGACGNGTVCGRPLADHDCVAKFLSNNYKFYLSFENAVCAEYVTEKLTQLLQSVDVIPVVLGGADYASFLPEGSYIDVRHYSSPKHLAQHLLELHANDSLYSEYLDRKNSVECRRDAVFHCRLCEYLHVHRHEQQRVQDAAAFWSYQHRCTPPEHFYQGVADEIIQGLNSKNN